ncbi:MAG TPA: hypothetical protein VH878_09350 [Thermodesulfobacteriota bacterium]
MALLGSISVVLPALLGIVVSTGDVVVVVTTVDVVVELTGTKTVVSSPT